MCRPSGCRIGTKTHATFGTHAKTSTFGGSLQWWQWWLYILIIFYHNCLIMNTIQLRGIKMIVRRTKQIFVINFVFFFMRLFQQCAFSCASSAHQTFCRNSCIAYRQRVSRQCVKACDTSDHWSDCKSSCTAHMQRAFLQCV